MGDVWAFSDPVDETQEYADGTLVPHREMGVYLNGKKIGELEVHMHRRRGRDGRADVSFGMTAVVFGPPPGGN
jgi:hypothetical protein